MTFTALLFRNLRYHWRGNLAVVLGVALGTAVLTGALFVGDSLRGSLKALTLDQLGWVDKAMTPGRFFREELVKELHGEPVLLMQTAIARTDPVTKKTQTIPKATLLGVDQGFWVTDM